MDFQGGSAGSSAFQYTEEIMNTINTKGMLVQYIAENLPGMLPQKEIEINEMEKNGVLLTGISARTPGESIAPVVYMEDYQGETPEEICSKIAETLEKTNTPGIDVIQHLSDREFIKDHIRPVLCHSGTKTGNAICFKELGDMSLFLQIEIFKDAYVKITPSVLGMSGMSMKEAFTSAMENNKPTIYRMVDTLGMLFSNGTEPENLYKTKGRLSDPSDLLIVSNADIYQGAAAIFDERVRERLHELFGRRFYILPSSIHEMICCSAMLGESLGEGVIRDMVQEINAAEIAPADRLSDEVYICESGRIRVV